MKYNTFKPKNYLEIQRKYNLNSLLAKIIESHHYDENTIQSFFHPRLIYHDFSLFEEADLTLDRIYEAIENNEKICIYGDYDCDGILATTILVQAFLELGVQVGYHIPNRFEDGYGLNVQRVKQMSEKGYTLIITVDNGVKAFEAIDVANTLGIDVIVTDHHQFDQQLPDACSFIHTKLSPEYPFKEISGGFVAYKLASALLKRQDKYLYALAAITTISDMMPLQDENRSLVKKGLQLMNEEKFTSLELLLGNQRQYSTTTIGFTIAPKINSFGRLPELCHPNVLVKYFLKDAQRDFMVKVADMATKLNTKRQTLTQQQYQLMDCTHHHHFLFWSSEDVHEGLLGLLASKYTREYEKPSFVMRYDAHSGIYKGSARSVEGFSLHDFFVEHQDILLTSGGHALAGGFSVDKHHYDTFYQCVTDRLKDMKLESITHTLLIDEKDLTIENVESLALLEPFGMMNEEPLYQLENIKIKNISLLSEGKHIKIQLDCSHAMVDALYFHHGDLYDKINQQKTLSLIGTLNVNEFRNQKTLNFIVKDIL